MRDIIIGFALLWLLPWSIVVTDYIIKDEQEKIKMKKKMKKEE